MALQTQNIPATDEVKQFIENLSAKLKIVIKKHEQWEASNLGNSKGDDVCAMYLEGKILEVDRLRRDTDQLENPGNHFTKSYRIIEGHGTKLFTDLDKIETFGRNDLREKRKKFYQEIEDVLKLLAGKAHPSGRPCQDCEVQN